MAISCRCLSISLLHHDFITSINVSGRRKREREACSCAVVCSYFWWPESTFKVASIVFFCLFSWVSCIFKLWSFELKLVMTVCQKIYFLIAVITMAHLHLEESMLLWFVFHEKVMDMFFLKHFTCIAELYVEMTTTFSCM